jgi:lantibiotic modifying enzyme
MAAGQARLDHLCCGTLSRAEGLLTAGLKCGRREWVGAAEALAGPVAERLQREGIRAARTAGFEHGLFQPGFFQGVSGIGYELLRLSRPEWLPSVAGFESPAWRR